MLLLTGDIRARACVLGGGGTLTTTTRVIARTNASAFPLLLGLTQISGTLIHGGGSGTLSASRTSSGAATLSGGGATTASGAHGDHGIISGGGSFTLTASHAAVYASPATYGMSASAPSASGSKVQISPTDGRYNAYAAGVRASNGDFLATYTSNTDHVSAGTVKQRRSTNQGTSWGTATSIGSSTGSTSNPNALGRLGDGDLLQALYAGAPGAGGTTIAQLARSTDSGVNWGSAYRIDDASMFDYSATIMCAPVTLTDGSLLAVLWGVNVADSPQYAWVQVIRSTDNGVTWTPRSTPRPHATDHSYEEPQLATITKADGSQRVLLVHRRDDSDWLLNGFTPGQPDGYALQTCYSDDGGLTWSAETTLIARSSGTASTIQAPDGSVVVCYRSRTSSGYGIPRLARSTDYGVTFSDAGAVDSTGAHLGCDWIDHSPYGDTAYLTLVYAVEVSASVANVYAQRYQVATASTPTVGATISGGGHPQVVGPEGAASFSAAVTVTGSGSFVLGHTHQGTVVVTLSGDGTLVASIFGPPTTKGTVTVGDAARGSVGFSDAAVGTVTIGTS